MSASDSSKKPTLKKSVFKKPVKKVVPKSNVAKKVAAKKPAAKKTPVKKKPTKKDEITINDIADHVADNVLSELHIRLILRLFAEGRKPRDVQAILSDQFGVDIKYPLLCYYNPHYPESKLAQKWLEFFADERKKFLQEVSECMGASPGVRISRLWEMSEEQRVKGFYAEAAELLAQIRDETVAANLSSGAGLSGVSATIISTGSIDEKKAQLAAMLGIKSDALPVPAGKKKGGEKVV